MKTHSLTTLRASFTMIILGLSALMTTPPARAQTGAVRVSIPFSFENGSRHLPAGTYVISRSGPNMLLLRGKTLCSYVSVQSEESREPNKRSFVSFHRYGSRYLLHEVWAEGERTHQQTYKTKLEKELQRQAALAPQQGAELAEVEPR